VGLAGQPRVRPVLILQDRWREGRVPAVSVRVLRLRQGLAAQAQPAEV